MYDKFLKPRQSFWITLYILGKRDPTLNVRSKLFSLVEDSNSTLKYSNTVAAIATHLKGIFCAQTCKECILPFHCLLHQRRPASRRRNRQRVWDAVCWRGTRSRSSTWGSSWWGSRTGSRTKCAGSALRRRDRRPAVRWSWSSSHHATAPSRRTAWRLWPTSGWSLRHSPATEHTSTHTHHQNREH